MRVIAGKARGCKLNSVNLPSARPTLDRVKESIFSTIQFDLKNKVCLDAFSCTGSLGIEAISRGAVSVDFCEKDKKTYLVLLDNLKKTKFTNASNAYNVDVFDFILSSDRRYDFVFADPPYHQGFIEKLFDSLLTNKSLNDGAIIVCEHEKSIGFDDYIIAGLKSKLSFRKRKDFSDTSVSYLVYSE